jgi:hypothetical protein
MTMESDAPKKYGARKKFELPADVSFKQCPAGHELPNTEAGMECSSAQCALTLTPGSAPSPLLVNHEDRQFDKEVQTAQRGETYRRRLVPVPEGLTGADADDFVERRITELQPVAIAEMERQLRFGNDAERGKAARDLLDAGGHGKKDRLGAGANMIVINMGSSSNGSPPPLPYVGEIVDAATKALKP